MAAVVVNDHRASFEWQLARGASTATRTFSIDGVQETEAGISAVTTFRDAFLTGAGLSLSIIDPTKFWQPTGWRDNDPNEEPWDTVGCYAKIVTTREYQLESPGGGGGDEAVIQLDYDSDIDAVTITYQGTSTPKVYKTNGDEVSIRAGNPGYWFIENVVSGTTYFVFTAPDATFAAGSATITIP